MSSSPQRRSGQIPNPVNEQKLRPQRPGDAAACVWRDGLGPGYAVAASGRLVAYAASTARGPYRCS
jgi:hypothetical protein